MIFIMLALIVLISVEIPAYILRRDDTDLMITSGAAVVLVAVVIAKGMGTW